MDEKRLHTPGFIEAVGAARTELTMPQASEPEMDEWLRQVGWDHVRAVVTEKFDRLRGSAGHLPTRYLPYFCSCVLSDHGGGTSAHTLPPGFWDDAPPLTTGKRRVGYYAFWYFRRPRLRDGFGWRPVDLPTSFEVRWPKTDWRPRTTASPNPALVAEWEEKLGALKARLQHYLPHDLRGKIAMYLNYIPGVRFRAADGIWYDRPVVIGANAALQYQLSGMDSPLRVPYELKGQSHDSRWGTGDVFAARIDGPQFAEPEWVRMSARRGPPGVSLPEPEGGIQPTWTPVLLPRFPDFGIDCELAGGVELGETEDPQVVRDGELDAEDQTMARICERALTLVWRDPQLRNVGRSPQRDQVPGTPFLQRLVENYRAVLSKKLDRLDKPSRETLTRLRKQAEQNTRREFRDRRHDPAPRGWGRDVEREQPWKRRQV